MTATHKAQAQKVFKDGELESLVDNFIRGGNTLKSLKGVDDTTMNAIYSVAYNLYNSGKYEEAHKVFQFLCFFDHFQKKYWMGLGACRQMLKLYQEAVAAYSFAALLDINDPKPPLHAADCFLAMGNREAAESALHASIKWSGNNEEYKSLKERAEGILGILKKSGSAKNSKGKTKKSK
jgi:type III secretion system low calcium response chaperone LcrH/SycD